MKYCLLFGLLLLIYAFANSQSIVHPGGVKAPVYWYTTDPNAKVAGMRSNISAINNSIPLLNSVSTLFSLNFHPSLFFTGASRLPVTMNNTDVSSASYFTVYQSFDTSSENNIWHITRNNRTSLVLTTSRMADLDTHQYMNYTDVVPSEPKVNIYVQQKEKDSIALNEQTWNVGSHPSWPRLPVASFKGLIPEIIAYDRVLSGQERLQVASYLALKYGITLTEPEATYLNSKGEKIWDGRDYSSYHHNIAGIGRDDSAAFEQKKSTSSNNPHLLTISIADNLQDNSFLLWGDNGLPLTTGKKAAGIPNTLQKHWLVISYTSNRKFATDVMIDTKQIDAPLPAKPVYWLAIDRSGKGDFSLPGTEYIKMTHLDAQGRAHFTDVLWDKDRSGKDVFTIISAGNLLLSTLINNPSCNGGTDGSMEISTRGDDLPYNLIVTDHTGHLLIHKTVRDDKPVLITQIAAGKYYVKVVAESRQVYTDSFYINNADAPLPLTIASSYILQAEKEIVINAAEQMPEGISYQWEGPGNYRSFNSVVKLTQPGLYTLSCSKNGCSSRQEVMVNKYPDYSLSKVNVYPNPSSGVFSVKIALPKPADVSMTIYDPEGKSVLTRKVKGFANYTYTNELSTAGMYKIVFRSGQSTAVRKLVIAK